MSSELNGNRERLGPAGRLAALFQGSAITPLLALVGLLLGLFAVLVTPREEEPQINVTFANVFIPFPGATAQEVEKLVSSPAEQVLAEIEGVEHVYSVSRPGLAVFGGGATESLVVVARQFLDAAVTYAQGDFGHRQPRMLH